MKKTPYLFTTSEVDVQLSKGWCQWKADLRLYKSQTFSKIDKGWCDLSHLKQTSRLKKIKSMVTSWEKISADITGCTHRHK